MLSNRNSNLVSFNTKGIDVEDALGKCLNKPMPHIVKYEALTNMDISRINNCKNNYSPFAILRTGGKDIDKASMTRQYAELNGITTNRVRPFVNLDYHQQNQPEQISKEKESFDSCYTDASDYPSPPTPTQQTPNMNTIIAVVVFIIIVILVIFIFCYMKVVNKKDNSYLQFVRKC